MKNSNPIYEAERTRQSVSRENKWVLMYDIYGREPHNFGFSETNDIINFKIPAHFNESALNSTKMS